MVTRAASARVLVFVDWSCCADLLYWLRGRWQGLLRILYTHLANQSVQTRGFRARGTQSPVRQRQRTICISAASPMSAWFRSQALSSTKGMTMSFLLAWIACCCTARKTSTCGWSPLAVSPSRAASKAWHRICTRSRTSVPTAPMVKTVTGDGARLHPTANGVTQMPLWWRWTSAQMMRRRKATCAAE